MIKWIVPDTSHILNENPYGLISYILGHEGEGSLLSWLISEGLGLGLTASHSHFFNYTNSDNSGKADEFSITVQLTEKGLEEWRSVYSIIMNAIEKLSKEGEESFRQTRKEQEKMNEIRFDFSPVMGALDSAVTISS